MHSIIMAVVLAINVTAADVQPNNPWLPCNSDSTPIARAVTRQYGVNAEQVDDTLIVRGSDYAIIYRLPESEYNRVYDYCHSFGSVYTPHGMWAVYEGHYR